MDHMDLTGRLLQQGPTVPTPIIEVLLRHRQDISLIPGRLEALLRTCLGSICQRQTHRGRNRRRPRSQLMPQGRPRIVRPMLAAMKGAVATRIRQLPPKLTPASLSRHRPRQRVLDHKARRHHHRMPISLVHPKHIKKSTIRPRLPPSKETVAVMVLVGKADRLVLKWLPALSLPRLRATRPRRGVVPLRRARLQGMLLVKPTLPPQHGDILAILRMAVHHIGLPATLSGSLGMVARRIARMSGFRTNNQVSIISSLLQVQ